MKLKDSGNRQEFGTGAIRDTPQGKGRFDLLPYDALHQLACVFEAGAKKYSERNWEAGIPVSRHIDSAIRHLTKAASGADDEPHLPLAMWNISAAIQTYIWATRGELPEFLVDRPMTLFDYESFTKPAGPHVSKAETFTELANIADELGMTREVFNINGHEVVQTGPDKGTVDGEYLQGTDFVVAVRRLRNGAKTVDEEVELAHRS